MGEDQVAVDPRLGLFGQLVHVQFAGGEHHLAQVAVDGIAVDVDLVEGVVEADFLELPVGAQQRAVVPQADVGERVAVGGDVVRRDRAGCGVFLFLDFVQPVSVACVADVIFDVGFFDDEFVGFDGELLHRRRVRWADSRQRQPGDTGDDQESPAADEDVEQQDGGSGEEDDGFDDVERHPRVDVGVARAEDDAQVRLQEGVAVENPSQADEDHPHRAQDRQMRRGRSRLDLPKEGVTHGDTDGGQRDQDFGAAQKRFEPREFEDVEADVQPEDRVGEVEGNAVVGKQVGAPQPVEQQAHSEAGDDRADGEEQSQGARRKGLGRGLRATPFAVHPTVERNLAGEFVFRRDPVREKAPVE